MLTEAAVPMSPAFLANARSYQPSSDPDTAAGETIALMTRYIKDSARDPLVKAEALRAIAQFQGMAATGLDSTGLERPGSGPATREQAQAFACWWWAKHNLEFIHHSKLLLIWLGNKDALQLLVSPDVIVHALNGSDSDARERASQGDCAVFSPMICALLEALGLDWELVIAAVDPSQPDIFTHVWPRVVLSDGRRISLDASHGKYPGWHVPKGDIYRLQVWDSSGRPVSDEGGTFTGLHHYTSRRGMGTDGYDDYGNFISTPDTSWNSSMMTPTPYYNPTQQTGDFFPPASTTSPGSSFNWSPVVGDLLNQWTQIGARVIAPQTSYQVGPHGEISYTTPGSAPVPTALTSSLGSSSSLLWIGGGVLALVVMASMFSKGKG